MHSCFTVQTVYIYFCETKALFRCKIFLNFDIVALSFVFDKHCPIMD